MKGEILSIGMELLMGEITDTNAPYIASQLPSLGITLRWISQVGDDLDVLSGVLTQALARSDVTFTTGGLGPTQDDLTREAIARALGEEIEVDSGLLKDLKRWFRSRGIEMPPHNVKQASLIPSAQPIPNNQGTAPGWWVEKEGKIIVALPGPPGEMRNIWASEVVPRLKGRVQDEIIITRNIKTMGLGEAEVDEKVSPFQGMENPYLGIYAKPDGIHLRIIARAQTEEAAWKLIRPVEEGIVAIMGPYVWGYDDETPEEAAAITLREKNLTLATMESCTGGFLASTITDVPGSSDYFLGGIVSYTNDAKIANGVPVDTIERYGAISRETAEAMAHAVRRRLGAHIGIGITGIAGPSDQEGKAVGTVFEAISLDQRVKSISLHLPRRRMVVKHLAVATALIELRRFLNEL